MSIYFYFKIYIIVCYLQATVVLLHRIKTNNPISSIHSVFPVKGNKTYIKNLMAYIPIKHTIPVIINY